MKKFLMIIGLLILIVTLLILFLYFASHKKKSYPTVFGATFSRQYAIYLGLDWKKTYLAILDDLKIKKIRLTVPWNEVEPTAGSFNFTDLDWQVAEAEKRGAEIILAFGRKVPRWPECHDPGWLSSENLENQQKRTLGLIKATVEHYKNSTVIKIWQVENEPFVGWFGNCPKPDKNFYQQEIALVKSLDSRPILTTDSGELGLWRRTAVFGDIFGTTLYRVVWNKYIGYWRYFFLPPSFYRMRAVFARIPMGKMIIAELQAEPWFKVAPADLNNPGQMPSIDEQYLSMSPKQLEENINYVKKVGFKEAYFWGVEWWYYIKLKGDNRIWEIGKGAINE